jgi:hypothetical protein
MAMVGFFTGAAVSSALTYLFDPQAGRRRRGLLRDKIVHLEHQVSNDVQKTARGAAHKARGMAAQARERVPFGDRLLAGLGGTGRGAGGSPGGTTQLALAGVALTALMVPFARRAAGRMLLSSLPQLLAIGAVAATRAIERQEQAGRARARRQAPPLQSASDEVPPATMIDPSL